jgi:predicted regulator of Ras-like GTPase activity (Roadblock/LC7/MglB family)
MSAKKQKLETILKEIEQNCEVDGAALVSGKGQIMCSALHADVDEKAVSAMAAALTSIGGRVGTVLKSGSPKGILVDGSTKMVMLRQIESSVLITTAPAGSKVGLIDFELDSASQKIVDVL